MATGIQLPGIDQDTSQWHLARLGEQLDAAPASSTKSIENITFLRRRFAWYVPLQDLVRQRLLIKEGQVMPTMRVELAEDQKAMAHGQFYEKYAGFALDWITEHAFDSALRSRKGMEPHFDTVDWRMMQQLGQWQKGGLWRHGQLEWLRASSDRQKHHGPNVHLAEIKSPLSDRNLSPSAAAHSYWSQVQQQIYVVHAEESLLFVYHVPTQRVTLLLIRPRLEAFERRLLPVMSAFHQALLHPEQVVLDYEADYSFDPESLRGKRKVFGFQSPWVPLMTKVHLPEVFPQLDNAATLIREEWVHGYDIKIPPQAMPRVMPAHAVMNCQRVGCRQRGTNCACGQCGQFRYCSQECANLDWEIHSQDCNSLV